MRQFEMAILATAVAISGVGCVSKSAYMKQKETADQLDIEKATLTSQLASMDQRSRSLEQDLAAARADNERLLTSLESKKGELNQRLAEMARQNQDLSQQLRETQQSKDAEINKLKGTYDQLVGNLKEQINAGQIQITQLAGRLSVNMVDKILFNSGEANVKPEGEKVLQKVGSALAKVQDKSIRVEGHTDNVPISGVLKDRFPSNWELSTARATAVVRYLQEKVSIPASRLIAAGYGENRPVTPNDTPEGRAQNRRIEIVLVPLEPTGGPNAVTSSTGTATSQGQ
jgi:chemotaxis protein MotB